MELKMYTAPETMSMNSKHHVRLKFQYGEHTAVLETYTLGNIAGGDVLNCYTDLETGFSVPVDHELTKKHAIFDEDDDYEEGVHKCREVASIRFTHPTRPDEIFDLYEVQGYLVGVEIIGYEDVEDDDIIECSHCDEPISSDEDDFHFEVPKGLFPAPFEKGTGVCQECWTERGYREHYERWINERFRVTFIDEKDAIDVPELTIGQSYWAINQDRQMVDICTDNEKIGTYCIVRFVKENPDED